MELNDLLPLYAKHPQVAALAKIIREGRLSHTAIEGLKASAGAMAFDAMTLRQRLHRPLLYKLTE